MLPFGRIGLKGQKSKPFAEQPVSLGEHLRKRRLERGLFQRDVAKLLASDPHSITEWEKDHAKPGIRFWPAIIAFLGYDPYPEPRTVGERLRAKRRALGFTIAEAARWLRVDEGTFGKWERGIGEPIRSHAGVVTRFLRAAPDVAHRGPPVAAGAFWDELCGLLVEFRDRRPLRLNDLLPPRSGTILTPASLPKRLLALMPVGDLTVDGKGGLIAPRSPNR